MRIARPDDLTDLASLGLTLAEGKQLLAGVQREIVAAQARVHAVRRPVCRGCGDNVCQVKDYGSVIGLLGLDLAVPDHTTLCRRAETLEVPRPRPRSNGEPLHLLVDSTGLRLCGPGEWLVEKHGTRTRRSWKKLHLGLDADTGQIVAVTLTNHAVD